MTHSEPIVNIIGEMIIENILTKDDIELVIIDDDGSRHSYFYDEKGYLKRWRYGFFSIHSH